MKSTMFASESLANTSISKPPSTFDTSMDRSFRGLTLVFAWLTILLMVYLLFQVGAQAAPAIQKYGLGFLTSTTWDVNKGQFGVLPEIWGTLYSSLLALMLGGFFGVAIAIFLTQDFLPPRLELVFKNIIELLAAIPSVVYGLWGREAQLAFIYGTPSDGLRGRRWLWQCDCRHAGDGGDCCRGERAVWHPGGGVFS